FQCSKKTWNADRYSSARLHQFLPCANYSPECDRNYESAFALIADHWRDSIDVPRGHSDENARIEDSPGSRISADLLTGYRVVDTKSTAPRVSVTRQVCIQSARSAPRPATYPIACDQYSLGWDDDEADAPAIHDLMQKDKLEEAWTKIAES